MQVHIRAQKRHAAETWYNPAQTSVRVPTEGGHLTSLHGRPPVTFAHLLAQVCAVGCVTASPPSEDCTASPLVPRDRVDITAVCNSTTRRGGAGGLSTLEYWGI